MFMRSDKIGSPKLADREDLLHPCVPWSDLSHAFAWVLDDEVTI